MMHVPECWAVRLGGNARSPRGVRQAEIQWPRFSGVIPNVDGLYNSGRLAGVVYFARIAGAGRQAAMTYVGPMTVIVAVVLAACFVAGAICVRRALSARSLARKKVCRRCRNVNPGCAKYCAHCGQLLDSN